MKQGGNVSVSAVAMCCMAGSIYLTISLSHCLTHIFSTSESDNTAGGVLWQINIVSG